MRYRYVVAAVAAGALCTAVGQASAATPGSTGRPAAVVAHEVGTLKTAEKGLPHTVKRGHTVTVTFSYSQNSHDVLGVSTYGMGLWYAGDWRYHGVAVTWLDPLTHRWEKPGSLADQLPEFNVPGPGYRLRLKPGATGRLTLRIAFAKNAHLGAWRLVGGVAGYQLFDKSGHPVDDWLLTPQTTYDFTVTR
jgi:hypothetical protein